MTTTAKVPKLIQGMNTLDWPSYIPATGQQTESIGWFRAGDMGDSRWAVLKNVQGYLSKPPTCQIVVHELTGIPSKEWKESHDVGFKESLLVIDEKLKALQ